MRRGLTQLKLSYLTDISPNDISAIENGWRKPYPGWKMRIAEALDIPKSEVDQLFEIVGSDEE